ncbi:MAG: hypothetical protein M1365_15155 [Actinobacteria bacterium]|nr:hypothetical protein [Actinomycetota bacterium]
MIKKDIFTKALLLIGILVIGLAVRFNELSKNSDIPLKIDYSAYENVRSDWDFNDNVWNYVVALNISKGHGISASLKPPYKPTMFRSPGLPVFLGASFFIFGESNTRYVVLTVFLFSFILLGFVVWKYYGYLEAVCFISLISFADAIFLWRESMVTSYIPLLFFVTALYLAVLTVFFRTSNHNKLLAFIIGIITAVIILIRSEFIFLPILTVIILVFMKKVKSNKERFIYLTLLILGIVTLYSPWLLRNYYKFNTLSPGGRAGFIISYKALASEAVSQGYDYWDFYRKVNINTFIQTNINDYINRGGAPDKLSNIEQSSTRKGLSLLAKHPLSFFKSSWEEFKCGQSFNPTKFKILGSVETSYYEKIRGEKPNFFFAILCMIGVLISAVKSPIKNIFIFHVALYYILVNSLINSGGCLYNTNILPFYYIAFSLLLGIVLRRALKYFSNKQIKAAL